MSKEGVTSIQFQVERVWDLVPYWKEGEMDRWFLSSES